MLSVTAPRLESCYFGTGVWERMARVLAHTAAQHCPGWTVLVRAVEPSERVSLAGNAHNARNVEKMEEWCRLVADAREGDRLLLMDADTFIVNALDDVWDEPFDVAYTVKAGRYPFNCGVVFLRISDRVKVFMEGWAAENVRMLSEPRYHQPWRLKYGGINQAAFGAILHRGGAAGLSVRTLPCRVWNCEDTSWATFDPSTTRIVHLKSALRRALFQGEYAERGLIPLMTAWRSIDREADELARSA